MAAEQIDFHEILNALLSFNNEVRQSAEVCKIINSFDKNNCVMENCSIPLLHPNN